MIMMIDGGLLCDLQLSGVKTRFEIKNLFIFGDKVVPGPSSSTLSS